MSQLSLNSINIYEEVRTLFPFVVADVVDDGGYQDPAIITSEFDLYHKFRYAENFESYLRILRAGGTLALVGNMKEFGDFPTLVVFNQNSQLPKTDIKFATPLYEDLFKNYEEILEREQAGSTILSKGISEYVGFESSTQYTYRILIKPKTKTLARDLLSSSSINTLVLPRKNVSASSNDNFAILFQNSRGYPSYSNIPKGYKGITGIIAGVRIEETDTNKQVLTKILNAETFVRSKNEYQKLTDIYYINDEEFYLVNEEDPYLVLETPYPIKYFDFCQRFCDVFEFINDKVFTQTVNYLRGLKYQGIALSCYSNFANKEGRGIEITYKSSPNSADLEVRLEEELYTYTGILDQTSSEFLFNFVKDNPLITITDLTSYSMINNVEYSIVVSGESYKTNSFKEPEHDLNSLIASYESLFEYEVPVTYLIAPRNPMEYLRTPLIQVLRNSMKDKPSGGLFATLGIQLPNENAAELHQALKLQLKSDKVFYFSGEFNSKAVYEYIIKWLHDRNFNADSGCVCIPGFEEALNFSYNGYEISYKEDSDFIISLGISHVITSIYNVLYPGITLSRAKTLIASATAKALDYNPQLVAVITNSIKQEGHDLIVDLDINYKSIPRIIKVNFKIYKTYGGDINS